MNAVTVVNFTSDPKHADGLLVNGVFMVVSKTIRRDGYGEKPNLYTYAVTVAPKWNPTINYVVVGRTVNELIRKLERREETMVKPTYMCAV